MLKGLFDLQISEILKSKGKSERKRQNKVTVAISTIKVILSNSQAQDFAKKMEVLEQIYEHWRKNENVEFIVSIDKKAEPRVTQNSSNKICQRQ